MAHKIARRASYKGQLTIVKKNIEKYIQDPEQLKADDAKVDLICQRDSVERIEAKYSEIQTEIIVEAEAEDVEREEQDLQDFLAQCAAVHFDISRLIAQIPQTSQSANQQSENARSSDSNGSGTTIEKMMMLLQTQMSEQRSQMDTLLRCHREDMRSMMDITAQAHSTAFNTSVNQSGSKSRARLEPIQVPDFSGKYTEWKTFQDLFISMVHNDEQLSGSQKMHYLKKALKGEAALEISNLSISDENYEIAWKVVKKRYDDNYRIINSHIEMFLKQPSVSQPTGNNLRKIYSTSTSILQALGALNCTQRDPWLIHIVKEKLDAETQLLWSREIGEGVPTWEQFETFLNKRCKSLEFCSPVSNSKLNHSQSNQKLNSKSHKSQGTSCIASSSQSVCPNCNKNNHKLFKCRDFLSMNPSKRLEIVKSLKICQNCLCASHSLNDCSYSLCKQCNEKHNTLLHDSVAPLVRDPIPSTSKSSKNETPLDKPSPASSLSCIEDTQNSSARILLATARVKVLDGGNGEHICRILLDAGSQVNLMTTHLCQTLRLKSAPTDFHLEGIGSINHVVKRKASVRLLLGEQGGENVVNVECLIVKRITGDHPNFKINKETVPIPNSIQLADPDWNKCQPIDILIGGEFFWNFVKDNTKTLGPNAPLLKDSVFGWLLVGPLSQEPSTNSSCHAQCNLSTLASLDASLRMFWEIEEIPHTKNSIDEHNEVEQLYRSSTSRNEYGRYIVRLPLNDRIGELGNNRASATHQFLSLERRLGKKEDLKIAYSQAIKEYLDLKIIEEVPPHDLDSPSYYLPHHGVVREQAISTKLRIVFNASARSQSGVSLNQCLMVGPVVQSSLVEVLWRFRLHKYALTCDIVKMYLQVLLVPEHKNYQRFIWRENPSDQIGHYRFRTVCFGIASSPYLATRTLNQLADDEGQSFPMAVKAVKESFYVDDCLASVPEQEQVSELKHQLIQLMERGQFQLAKFKSNCSVEVDDNQESHSDVTISDTLVKTLGLIWNSKSDTFQFKLSNDLPKTNVTKRQILSVIARIYDPLGLLGPVVTNAKLILQAAWQCKTDWDMVVPDDLLHRWALFISDLPSIELLRIPRWAADVESPTQVELHVFSDASSLAYGAALFLVCEDVNGHRSSRLLTAKSKITPLKSTEAQGNELTIPKAELLGAQMAAELMFMVSKALGIDRRFYWTDAAVVLHQIYSPSEKRETFVRNKVRNIRKLSQVEEWGHVPTKQNPADAISRGSTVQELMVDNLWWLGPDWLTKERDSWPAPFSPHTFSITRDTSFKSVNVVSKDERNDHPPSVYTFLMSRISVFRRMQRVLAWCLRASTILKTFKGRKTRSTTHSKTLSGPLTAEELLRAETFIVKWEQRIHLLPIINALKKGNLDQQPRFKFVRRLRPFLDEDGLLRVGGRLHNSAEPYDAQHPKILPKGKLANLLALQYHLNLLHGGPTILLSSLRQRYWPLGGRSLARQIVYNCVPCFKAKPRYQTQIMADLPEHRVTSLRPFFATGMDFAGPLLLKSGSRKTPQTKAYIIVMVCMSTKATHLDLVSSLSTDAFIASLRRFTARRGIPSFIYSDNGTTFVGADGELKKMLQSMSFSEEIGNFMASLEIKWRFQPPRAPHHGGLWEATVKSCKHHLKRVLGMTPLTFEEMSTILSQIEAVLNSRPLFQLPSVSDVKDPSCLTPGHFLVGSALTQLPDPNLGHLSLNRLDRWQLCQRLQQNFTEQWKRDYLHTLQARVKWSKEFPNIKVGDVVLHLNEQTPSTSWPLGVISSIFPGKDGKIRVVDVKTAHGIFRRPVTKIVKLPTNDELEKIWSSSGEDVRAQM